MINLTEIRERADAALKWANRCDRTKAGCQVPQITKVLNNVPALCDEIERLQAENERLTARAEKAEAERDRATEDIEKLLGQEDYLGVCWACAKDCKKGDVCIPKYRGLTAESEG